MSVRSEDCCASPSLLSVDEALEQLLSSVEAITDTEVVAIEDALGRVSADAITASINVPGYDNSAMDGYAVRSEDCTAAGTVLKVSQRIPAGQTGERLNPGEAARIFTGAPVPPGADAVVMQEQCTAEGDNVTINSEVKPGQNIRRAGEDIKAGSVIIESGKRLRHQELGLIASVGNDTVNVVRKLSVAVFFTGDEIIKPGEELKPGQIYNSNSYTLRGFLQSLDCDVIDLGIVPDNLDATIEVIEQAAVYADLIITSGGVSVGEEDYVKLALEKLGTLSLWRIAMKPGKPLAFGRVDEAAFMGLPGNPVSVFVTSMLFARPLIKKMQGCSDYRTMTIRVEAAFEWKAGKRLEYLRARLDDSGKVSIYPHQGSGVLSSASWANGLVVAEVDKDIAPDDIVSFIPF